MSKYIKVKVKGKHVKITGRTRIERCIMKLKLQYTDQEIRTHALIGRAIQLSEWIKYSQDLYGRFHVWDKENLKHIYIF